MGKSNKTLHSVLARRTTKDDNMPTKTGEAECDGSEEETGSDMGYNLLSKTWSREVREKQNINNDGGDGDKLRRERWVKKTVLKRVAMRENRKIGNNNM